ncbi:MAG: cyclase family protein [Sphingomonas bacterium]|nr:cyclase family protein [Sphingomonas bacterium]
MAHDSTRRLVDLSHVIRAGMTTYKGFPGPALCDFWTREQSASHYDDGSSFQIGRIDMIANTGTYVDAPFHRFANSADLAGLALETLADLDALVVRRPYQQDLATDAPDVAGLEVRGRAVLVHTGWDRFWGTDAYFDAHPFLTEAAARLLADSGAAFVGIDSHNIDDTRTRSRPVHTILLGAGIPIGEHLTNLAALPDEGARFTAVPPKIAGMGTFPVRAFGVV